MYINAAAEASNEDLTGLWESVALVGALSAGALVITWRRKDKRSSAGTHWAVLLSAHGGLVVILHVSQTALHLGGALVITAMAERVIWDVSDGLAERIDNLFKGSQDTYEADELDTDLTEALQ